MLGVCADCTESASLAPGPDCPRSRSPLRSIPTPPLPLSLIFSAVLSPRLASPRLDAPRRATPQGYVASSRPVTYLLIASQCHRRWCARIPSLCRTSTHSHWPTKAIVQMEYYCFLRTKSSTVNTVRENKIDTRHDLDTSGELIVCVSVTIEFKWISKATHVIFFQVNLAITTTLNFTLWPSEVLKINNERNLYWRLNHGTVYHRVPVVNTIINWGWRLWPNEWTFSLIQNARKVGIFARSFEWAFQPTNNL